MPENSLPVGGITSILIVQSRIGWIETRLGYYLIMTFFHLLIEIELDSTYLLSRWDSLFFLCEEIDWFFIAARWFLLFSFFLIWNICLFAGTGGIGIIHSCRCIIWKVEGSLAIGSAVRTKTVDRLILILLPWFLFKNRQALRQLLNPPYQIPMMLMRGGKKKELECLA